MKVLAIVLTYNEALHLPRCLKSLEGVVDRVLVVDSFSNDETEEVARSHGAEFLQNPFVNQALQFNWGLTHVSGNPDWILRIDADEYLTPALAEEVRARLPGLGLDIDGVTFARRMTFQGRLIRFGGVFPVRVVRLFRFGRGECENRWMDEHIRVEGKTLDFDGELVDDNLNSLTWWTDKHNRYASREAVEMLSARYGFAAQEVGSGYSSGTQASFKRSLKQHVYVKLPGGIRALLYFFYRYVVRLGFLDGRAGFAFHVLQGFWYRYLVDAKVDEVERYMRIQNVGPAIAIDRVLGIKLDTNGLSSAD